MHRRKVIAGAVILVAAVVILNTGIMKRLDSIHTCAMIRAVIAICDDDANGYFLAGSALGVAGSIVTAFGIRELSLAKLSLSG